MQLLPLAGARVHNSRILLYPGRAHFTAQGQQFTARPYHSIAESFRISLHKARILLHRPRLPLRRVRMRLLPAARGCARALNARALAQRSHSAARELVF